MDKMGEAVDCVNLTYTARVANSLVEESVKAKTYEKRTFNLNSTIRLLNRKTRRKILNSKRKLGNKNVQGSLTLNSLSLLQEIREIKQSQQQTEAKLDFLVSYFKSTDRTFFRKKKGPGDILVNSYDNSFTAGNHTSRNCFKNKTQLITPLNEFSSYQSDSDKTKNLALNVFGFEIISSKSKLSADNVMLDYFSFKIKPELSLSSLNEDNLKRDYKRTKCASPDRLISHKFFEDTENYTNLMSGKNLNLTGGNPFNEQATPVRHEDLNTRGNAENDNSSLASSKFHVDSSNEKYKKVRGFNFKNNINTKKYSRPLVSSQASKENVLLNSTPNLSCFNFDDKSLNGKINLEEKRNNIEINKMDNSRDINMISSISKITKVSNNVISRKISDLSAKESDKEIEKERSLPFIDSENEVTHQPITISDLTNS